MHLRVYTPELNGEQAYELMQKEGTNHVVKDSDRFGHIWLEGHNGPTALSYFEPDRDVDYCWYGWEKEAKGWVGLASRGWRTKTGDHFAYVVLLYVGEDVIRAAHAKEQRTLNLQAGVLRVYPYGVPKPTPRIDGQSDTAITVTYIETLKTPEERFRAVFRRGNEPWKQAEEFESWGVKGYVDNDHIVALLPKTGLATFRKAMSERGIDYDESLTLNDLKRHESGEDWRDDTYEKPGSTVRFNCKYLDKAVRAFYPRFVWARDAPRVKIHYPDKQAPIVLLTEEHDWFIVAAPYVY